MKKSLLVGAAVATVIAGSGGLAMAATSSSTGGDTLAQKIASKFGLNASDVQSVIDQNREDKQAQHEANFKTNLAAAVKDGKITQAQADHITGVMSQIDSLRAGKTPDQLDQSTKDQIKKLMQDLRQWAKDNNVKMQFAMGANGGHGRMGRMMHNDADDK